MAKKWKKIKMPKENQLHGLLGVLKQVKGLLEEKKEVLQGDLDALQETAEDLEKRVDA